MMKPMKVYRDVWLKLSDDLTNSLTSDTSALNWQVNFIFFVMIFKLEGNPLDFKKEGYMKYKVLILGVFK